MIGTTVVLLASMSMLSAEEAGLVFDPVELDMGSVLEGEKATATLLIRNNSNNFKQIVKIESSCGCTTAEPENRLLAAGAFTPLHIVVDTFGKLGDVRKSISLTDGQGNIVVAWLTMHVQKNVHLMGKDRSIFEGKCAACHFEPAKGKMEGSDIYKAVCEMCHGVEGRGAYAPKLRKKYPRKILSSLITHGVGSQHMPGFAQENGGPLSDKQITALTEWLLSLDE